MPVWTCPPAGLGVNDAAPGVPGAGKTVALTFDDGPGASTAAILSILESYGVRATFFNIGEQAPSWRRDVEAESADGFLVADHTWSHPELPGLTAVQQAAQLDRAAAAQRAIGGTSPCELRPPYGEYDSTTLSVAAARHMSVWLWSVDTEDWEAEGSASSYWVRRIIGLAESEGGALQHPVVLLHDQQSPMPATVAALPAIIAFFRSHGYTFVDLLGRSGRPAGCGSRRPPDPSATVRRAGTRLAGGQSLASPGGQYRLLMQADGNLVLYAGKRALWTSGTAGHPGATAALQNDGNFVVASRSGRVLWSSHSGGHPGAVLAVRADGSLALEAGRSLYWWSGSGNSGLAAGEALRQGWYVESPGSACRLRMNREGDLVLQASSGAVLWRTGTAVPGAFAVMQTDGNLVVRSPAGRALWSSGTSGNPGDSLYVGRNGSVFIESASGTMRWFA